MNLVLTGLSTLRQQGRRSRFGAPLDSALTLREVLKNHGWIEARVDADAPVYAAAFPTPDENGQPVAVPAFSTAEGYPLESERGFPGSGFARRGDALTLAPGNVVWTASNPRPDPEAIQNLQNHPVSTNWRAMVPVGTLDDVNQAFVVLGWTFPDLLTLGIDTSPFNAPPPPSLRRTRGISPASQLPFHSLLQRARGDTSSALRPFQPQPAGQPDGGPLPPASEEGTGPVHALGHFTKIDRMIGNAKVHPLRLLPLLAGLGGAYALRTHPLYATLAGIAGAGLTFYALDPPSISAGG